MSFKISSEWVKYNFLLTFSGYDQIVSTKFGIYKRKNLPRTTKNDQVRKFQRSQRRGPLVR